MRKEEFAEIFGDINENYIREAERMKRPKKSVWLRWGKLSACFLLFIATIVAIPNLFPNVAPTLTNNTTNQSEGTESVEDMRVPWTVHFNEVTSVLDASRAYIKGYFTEQLSDTELEALEPSMCFEYMNYSGYAGFDQDGNLLDVNMMVTTSLPDHMVTVSITDYSFGSCYVVDDEEEISVCENVEYKVYQYESANTVTLGAESIINDFYFHFSMDTAKMDLEQAKEEFKCVLECFAKYEEGKPDFSIIVPEEIPELTEIIFSTLSEAQSESDFGQYMPSEIPDEFGEAAIRRFKFQNSNYLSGLWSKGLDDLTWIVRPFTEEEAYRLTSVENKENYDLSLYPIPRADSVPDELREIVDNPIFMAEELTLDTIYCRAYKVDDVGDTDGWRMKFSVKYGDVIVEVSAKGVEPEWMYQQLMAISNK